MHITITRGPATGPDLYTFSARDDACGDGCYDLRHIATIPKVGVEACKSLMAGPGSGKLKAIALFRVLSACGLLESKQCIEVLETICAAPARVGYDVCSDTRCALASI